jgi:predicted transposase/invertase (TIGR01784 family)
MDTAINEGLRRGQTEGRAIGLAEGRVEGRVERDIEIARNMKKDGVDLTIIAKYTGLSAEEIESLN